MDEANQLGEFLRARRELTSPSAHGLSEWPLRRVPGLRREEVAMLAGVSTDYYVRLEQGRNRRPSAMVIAALARVFDLDQDATDHLRRLADAPRLPRRRAPRPERVPPGMLALLDGWGDIPAFITGRRLDILACTPLLPALHPGLAQERNLVRMLFLDDAERAIYPDWPRVARDAVSWLRATAGAENDDPRMSELVGELSLRSPEFAELWLRHGVHVKTSGTKRLLNPVVGELTLSYESLAAGGSAGLVLTIYHAPPRSPDAQALALLSSHAATLAASHAPTIAADVILTASPPVLQSSAVQERPCEQPSHPPTTPGAPHD